MKIRTGFVSNSSSSSFIALGHKPEKVHSLKITEEYTLKRLAKAFGFTLDQDVYLTELVADCLDSLPEESNRVISYLEGDVGGREPYNTDDTFEVDGVFFKIADVDFSFIDSNILARAYTQALENSNGGLAIVPLDFSGYVSTKKYSSVKKQIYACLTPELKNSFKEDSFIESWLEYKKYLLKGLLEEAFLLKN